jgi:hypothetical protein
LIAPVILSINPTAGRKKACALPFWCQYLGMNDIICIPVRNGFTIVDVEDAPKATNGNWFIDTKGYVVKSLKDTDGKWKRKWLHREVKQLPDGVITDHKNRFKFDNTKRNLRPATNGQNRANACKSKSSKSKFKGVCFNKGARGQKKWQVAITIDGLQIRKHCYTELEAAHEYNALAKQYFGEYALLNDVENSASN